MSITVKRRTGLMGSGTRMKIKINGETVEKIAINETKEIELPDETATLQLSQFYSYSEKLEVKDGQSVEVSTKETAKLLVLLLLLMIPVLQLGSSFPGNIPLLLGTLLVFFIVHRVYPTYHLHLLPLHPENTSTDQMQNETS